MKYLAIDTSGETVSVLVCAEEKVIFRQEKELRRTSESLLPLIDSMLDEAGLGLYDMEFFACVTGPGSFTGIRLGVVATKIFAYVAKKPVIAVTSLEKLAYNDISAGAESVVLVVHAYSDYCYFSAFDADKSPIIQPQTALYEEAAELISGLKKPCAVVSDSVSADFFTESVTDDARYSLLRAVEDLFAKGRLLDYRELEPYYILKSQAERELEEKQR